MHLRIDSIEQALRNSHVAISGPEGYVAAYAIAEDNLRLGHTVIADSVNPVGETRAAWREVAGQAGQRYVEIEVVCSNPVEHRRRVESRVPDITGLRLPMWRQVCDREYESWQAGIVVNTAGMHVDESVAELRKKLEDLGHTLGRIAGVEK